jgi:hypothetical protein
MRLIYREENKNGSIKMIGPLKTILLNFEPKTAFLRQFLAFLFSICKKWPHGNS